ncbi:hypothetical protein [Derxia lacustris]|uniref:hypothetical protein n=1 Tax=Derxia lacustris TaxID=764842 RepID=UPI001C385B61|nr:hypothetical protein [Derxia lacustris]
MSRAPASTPRAPAAPAAATGTTAPATATTPTSAIVPPPLDATRLRRVGRQLGSNPAAVFEADDGSRYYIKTLDTPAHARNEWLAAQLYRLAGAPTLDYVQTLSPDEIATVFVPLDKKTIAQLDEAERREAQRWLGVHAWTANWDAAGFNGDNQGVAGGRVLTLDVGGALEFRALGDPKGSAFGTTVGELDSLRADPDNRRARAGCSAT